MLLSLKADYKKLTGKEWKPDTVASTTNQPNSVAQDENTILSKISEVGDKIRNLKTQKAEKTLIDPQVKLLLELKAQYKTLTGKDWKPGTVPQTASQTVSNTSVNSNSTLNETVILEKISQQGDKVRILKTQKADKPAVDAEVKVLLELKSQYKSLTGKDWKPGAVAETTSQVTPIASPITNSNDTLNETVILEQISHQGDKVRVLKTQKADKPAVDAEVKILLDLKSQYKSLTGKDWKPSTVAQTVSSSKPIVNNENDLLQKISEQGDKVRTLKGAKSEKSVLDAEIKRLLELKSEFKSVTGKDWKPDMKPAGSTAASFGASGDVNVKNEMIAKVTAQGDVVRNLKSAKASKVRLNFVNLLIKFLNVSQFP